MRTISRSPTDVTLAAVRRYWVLSLRGDPGPNPFDDVDAAVRRRVLLVGGRPAYAAYRRSRPWREFRAAMLELVDYACEDCGVSETESVLLVLDVHHLHYRSIGAERPEDVAVLCRPCHEEADRERRRLAR